MEIEDVDGLAEPRPLWPLAVGAGVLVLAGVGAWWALPRDPRPDRVRVTANALRERYPRAARGGRRGVFDRLGERRYRSFPRVATRWLERPD